MNTAHWLEAVRMHLAVVSVGASTLRMQSNEGGVGRAREFLKKSVSLEGLADLGSVGFGKLLDGKTVSLAKQLPRRGDQRPNWGAARKVMNIFLRSCAMNRDLFRAYRLSRVEPFLEVPLDRQIVAGIDRDGGQSFSREFTIRDLDRRTSQKIQDAAMDVAKGKGLFRYQLDVLYWNTE